MTDNIINLKNNTLQFKYFSNKNKPEKDWIPFGDIADGIFYKPTLVAYPYLVQENKLIKLDNKEQIDIQPFKFLVQRNQGREHLYTQTFTNLL